MGDPLVPAVRQIRLMHRAHQIDPMPSDERATYEIRFRGEIPPDLSEWLPSATVHRCPAETVLSRDVVDDSELDLLLDHLQTVGLALSELNQSPVRRSASITGPLDGHDE